MDLTAMRPMDLDRVTELIVGATKPVNVLWQTDDSIAFVARGREGRSEFHVDPSDEVMYMIRGDMNLHYRTADGAEKVAVIREGEILHCPACDAPLHQAVRQVGDWRDDPVSEVYAEFYGAESHRTCGKCGHVTPRPEARR